MEGALNTTVHGNGSLAPPDALGFTLAQSIPLAFVLFLVIVGAAIGNIIVVGTLAQTWPNTIGKPGNLLVFWLAVADGLLALLVMPFSLVTTIGDSWILGDVFCQIEGFLFTFLTTSSNMALGMISLNRYYKVSQPSASENIARARAKKLLVYGWVHAAAVAVTVVAGWGNVSAGEDLVCLPIWDTSARSVSNLVFVSIAAYILPSCIMGITYYRIFHIVRRRSMKVIPHASSMKEADRNGSVATNNGGAQAGNGAVAGPSRPTNGTAHFTVQSNGANGVSVLPRAAQPILHSTYHRHATENKTVVTLLIILGMFMVLWTPFIIVTFVRSFAPELVGPSVRASTILMVFVNSAANPVVYSLRNTSFRAAARDFVCACGC
ncbi:5-hydroxytryptamine receptor 4-like [Branchiostoma lanceolatum]|uniref:5-hydroxytryptamine receptor 4-like n=1 Tax=Branchiostoma lanceolatum TaxID=7740 RepID=UPI003452DC69